MSRVISKRLTTEGESDIVVFLIGMRINKIWKVWKWLPVFLAMPRMLVELGKNPQLGMLHARTHFGLRNTMVVQYWENFEKLHAYAVSKDNAHLPAWKAFNKNIGSNGDVGIWHETYLIPASNFEAVYSNMPPHGLGRALELTDASGRKSSAKGRLSETD